MVRNRFRMSYTWLRAIGSASFTQHVMAWVGVLCCRLVVQHVVEGRRVVMEEYRFVGSEGTPLPHNKGTALQAAG